MPDVEQDTAGYKPIFGVERSKDGNKKPIPRWVPVTLLAISTAAMVVPIILLRRHRAATLGKTLAAAPPPPRRTTSSRGIPIVNPTSNPSLFSVRDSALPSSSSTPSLSAATRAGDDFNGPLYCAKAFSLATFAVGAGAFVSIWGVRQYMGVETTQEFADRMRTAILTRMPMLSARIHRPPEPEDGDATLPPEPPSAVASTQLDVAGEWSWTEAEERLKSAFDKHGFSGWVAAAMQELEAEGRIERTKRGHM